MRTYLIAGIALALGIAWGGNAVAAPTTRGVPAKGQVEELVAQLGSGEWKARDQAQKKLIEIGWEAIPALRAARLGDDPEVVSRSTQAIEEIVQRVEVERNRLRGVSAEGPRRTGRRPELRRAATAEQGGINEGYFAISSENYLALLALPEPPLRDCYPAMFVFRQKEDWASLALALQKAGEALARARDLPLDEFVRVKSQPAEEPKHVLQLEEKEPIAHVYVQAAFDGRWDSRPGTVEQWKRDLARAREQLQRDEAGVYLELGRVYRDRLKDPKKALAAFRLAVAREPFCAEKLESLVGKVYPKMTIGPEALWSSSAPTGASWTSWSTRDALTDLSETQEQEGEVMGALETRIRLMIVVRLLERTWNNYRQEPQKVYELVKKLPADAKLPPLPIKDSPETAADFLKRFGEKWKGNDE